MQTPGRKGEGEKKITFDMVSKKVIPAAYSKRSTLNMQASRKGMAVSKSGVISSAMSAKPEKIKVF